MIQGYRGMVCIKRYGAMKKAIRITTILKTWVYEFYART